MVFGIIGCCCCVLLLLFVFYACFCYCLVLMMLWLFLLRLVVVLVCCFFCGSVAAQCCSLYCGSLLLSIVVVIDLFVAAHSCCSLLLWFIAGAFVVVHVCCDVAWLGSWLFLLSVAVVVAPAPIELGFPLGVYLFSPKPCWGGVKAPKLSLSTHVVLC